MSQGQGTARRRNSGGDMFLWRHIWGVPRMWAPGWNIWDVRIIMFQLKAPVCPCREAHLRNIGQKPHTLFTGFSKPHTFIGEYQVAWIPWQTFLFEIRCTVEATAVNYMVRLNQKVFEIAGKVEPLTINEAARIKFPAVSTSILSQCQLYLGCEDLECQCRAWCLAHEHYWSLVELETTDTACNSCCRLIGVYLGHWWSDVHQYCNY